MAAEVIVPITVPDTSDAAKEAWRVINDNFLLFSRRLNDHTTWITNAMLEDDVITATKINVVGLDGTSGRILVADATDANVVTGGINSYATTLITAGKIVISGSTNLDDWSHGSDATKIDGGDIYTNTVTATQINVSDLVDIANLLTVASGRIVIGADALGAGLDGVLINDGTYDRVRMGELSANTYGLTILDSTGVTWTNAGKLQQVWQKVYDEILTANATSITVSGLNGNADHLYYIIWTLKSNTAVDCGASFQINGDTGANYGLQYIGSDAGTVMAGRMTGQPDMWLGQTNGQNQVFQSFMILHATTGKERTAVTSSLNRASGTTVGRWYSVGNIWNNTAANITSLTFKRAEAGNAIGIGSHLSIYKIPSY